MKRNYSIIGSIVCGIVSALCILSHDPRYYIIGSIVFLILCAALLHRAEKLSHTTNYTN